MKVKNQIKRSLSLKIEYIGGELISNLGINEEQEYNFDNIKSITIKYGNAKRGRKKKETSIPITENKAEEIEHEQEAVLMAEN